MGTLCLCYCPASALRRSGPRTPQRFAADPTIVPDLIYCIYMTLQIEDWLPQERDADGEGAPQRGGEWM